MDERLHELGAAIVRALPGAVSDYSVAFGDLTVRAEAKDVVRVATFLRDDPRCQFWCIIDITAVDWPSRENRFDVVYHFLSPKQNLRVRIKIETDEVTPVPSITGAFPGADWFEREIYDLYGVLFTGHPDLRRILMWDEFEDHPMRKDYVQPDDFEYEPTPHDEVLERAKEHYPARPEVNETLTPQT